MSILTEQGKCEGSGSRTGNVSLHCKFINQVPPTPLPANRYIDEIVSGLRDRGVHLLYCIAQLDTELAQNDPLPQILLGIDPRLDLLVASNAYSGSIECRPRLLDLRYELLQVRQRVSELVKKCGYIRARGRIATIYSHSPLGVFLSL